MVPKTILYLVARILDDGAKVRVRVKGGREGGRWEKGGEGRGGRKREKLFQCVRKYCSEYTVTVITCLVVAKELFILCALFIPSSHHSSFSVSFMPCSYL